MTSLTAQNDENIRSSSLFVSREADRRQTSPKRFAWMRRSESSNLPHEGRWLFLIHRVRSLSIYCQGRLLLRAVVLGEVFNHGWNLRLLDVRTIRNHLANAAVP